MIWLTFCAVVVLGALAGLALGTFVGATPVRRSMEHVVPISACQFCEIKRAIPGTPDVPNVPRAVLVQPGVPRTNGHAVPSSTPARSIPARADVSIPNTAHEA